MAGMWIYIRRCREDSAAVLFSYLSKGAHTTHRRTNTIVMITVMRYALAVFFSAAAARKVFFFSPFAVTHSLTHSPTFIIIIIIVIINMQNGLHFVLLPLRTHNTRVWTFVFLTLKLKCIQQHEFRQRPTLTFNFLFSSYTAKTMTKLADAAATTPQPQFILIN